MCVVWRDGGARTASAPASAAPVCRERATDTPCRRRRQTPQPNPTQPTPTRTPTPHPSVPQLAHRLLHTRYTDHSLDTQPSARDLAEGGGGVSAHGCPCLGHHSLLPGGNKSAQPNRRAPPARGAGRAFAGLAGASALAATRLQTWRRMLAPLVCCCSRQLRVGCTARRPARVLVCVDSASRPLPACWLQNFDTPHPTHHPGHALRDICRCWSVPRPPQRASGGTSASPWWATPGGASDGPPAGDASWSSLPAPHGVLVGRWAWPVLRGCVAAGPDQQTSCRVPSNECRLCSHPLGLGMLLSKHSWHVNNVCTHDCAPRNVAHPIALNRCHQIESLNWVAALSQPPLCSFLPHTPHLPATLDALCRKRCGICDSRAPEAPHVPASQCAWPLCLALPALHDNGRLQPCNAAFLAGKCLPLQRSPARQAALLSWPSLPLL